MKGYCSECGDDIRDELRRLIKDIDKVRDQCNSLLPQHAGAKKAYGFVIEKLEEIL